MTAMILADKPRLGLVLGEALKSLIKELNSCEGEKYTNKRQQRENVIG